MQEDVPNTERREADQFADRAAEIVNWSILSDFIVEPSQFDGSGGGELVDAVRAAFDTLLGETEISGANKSLDPGNIDIAGRRADFASHVDSFPATALFDLLEADSWVRSVDPAQSTALSSDPPSTNDETPPDVEDANQENETAPETRLAFCGCAGCVAERLENASAMVDEHSGQQGYVLNGVRWEIDPLVHQVGATVTWSIATANYVADYIQFDGFITGQFINVIRAAFDAWEAVTNIDFIESSDSSNIDIRLGYGDIDGPSGTLGIAYYSYDSDDILTQSFIEFDESENWDMTIGAPQSGFGAYVVALHEIGHAIGISHSNVSGAVMAAFYNSSLSGLTQDDINAAQAIYGEPGAIINPPPSNSAPQDVALSANSVTENAAAGTVVGFLSADDPDSGDTHSYQILSGQSESGSENFTIVGNQLRVAAGANIDFESDSSIQITIRATDNGGLSVDRSFAIQVENQPINDIAITSGGSVSENAVGGTAVATFAAYESGTAEPNAQLTLLSNGGGLFYLAGDTLRVVNGARLDFESDTNHTVRIRATDDGGSVRDEVFTIQVSNIPVTDIALLSGGTVAENAGGGTVVATFAASESGLVEPAAQLSLVDDAGGLFELDGDMLKVADGAAFDFESAPSHTVRILATDGSGGSRQEDFVIDVVNTPISDIAVTSGGSVTEGASAGTTVAVFQAFDDQPELTAQWTLTDDAGGRFVLDGNVLKVAPGAILDFEESTSHSVTIRASDGNGPAYQESFVIVVANSSISDITLVSGGTISENAAAGVAVAQFAALENGDAAEATFSLIEDAGGLFVLEGDTLRVAAGASLDFETATSHTVRLSASDGGQPYEEDFVIQVANMAISGIAFASGGSVDENSVADTIVATFEASENPIEPTATFNLVDDADGRFHLDGNQLKVANGALLDFEAATSHTVEVGATDGTGAVFSQAFIIQVNDVSGEVIWGTTQQDILAGTPEDDVIRALSSDDVIEGSGGPDTIDGDSGNDTVVYDGARADFDQDLLANGNVLVKKPDGSTDTLIEIERIDLADGDYVYDIDSDNLGFGYRIYQAAFGRIPDEGGIRFWIDVLDRLDADGLSQHQKQQFLASTFIGSAEFEARYGSDPTDFEYIEAMYQNVLLRSPDQGGFDYWVARMGDPGVTREDILISFTESAENYGITSPSLDDGVWVV